MRTNHESRHQTLPIPALPNGLAAALHAQVPRIVKLTMDAVVAEVPQYAPAVDGPYRAELADGVRMAFEGFAGMITDPQGAGPRLSRIRRGAHVLGRTEARRRRGIDALLTAYQVGTQVHWQEVAGRAIDFQVSAETMADLAGLIFAYNQQLSAASAEGYARELEALRRTRERQREALARALLAGEPVETLLARAQRADWSPPETLTVVLVTPEEADALTGAFPQALVSPPDESTDDPVAVLIPDVHITRGHLLDAVRGTRAIVGPARPWQQASISYRRALRARGLRGEEGEPLDTEDHLVELVLSGDPDCGADLRHDVLRPLAGLPEPVARRLAGTLRSWLLHLGRRDAVAADLYVHPQTVRYRMGQIRELFGEALNDPQQVLALVIALNVRD